MEKIKLKGIGELISEVEKEYDREFFSSFLVNRDEKKENIKTVYFRYESEGEDTVRGYIERHKALKVEINEKEDTAEVFLKGREVSTVSSKGEHERITGVVETSDMDERDAARDFFRLYGEGMLPLSGICEAASWELSETDNLLFEAYGDVISFEILDSFILSAKTYLDGYSAVTVDAFSISCIRNPSVFRELSLDAVKTDQLFLEELGMGEESAVESYWDAVGEEKARETFLKALKKGEN